MKRRSMLLTGGAAMTIAASSTRAQGLRLHPGLSDGVRETAVLDALPGKQPMIKLSYRPPNYETPIDAFRGAITANDRFFVRYHLSEIPDMAALANWRLRIGGDAAGQAVELDRAALDRLPQVEIAAVCQCSGNRRGLSAPHVPGVQWGLGAMGNAVWRGPLLRDVLALAGVKPGAVEIAYRGPDVGVSDATPVYAKSIPLDRAMNDTAMIATSMNGADLPHFNGYPARIVIPGWTATYWMKHVTQIEIRSTPLANFWMKTAYRIPTGMFPGSPFPTQETATNRPITDILVNSLITSHQDGDSVEAAGFTLSGVAWDNGSGIARAELSLDGGASWQAAALGPDIGRFGFRAFTLTAKAPAGPLRVLLRATSNAGVLQPDKPIFNGAGYHNNAVQTLILTVA
jgi:DMSO/TMAO reductase YedYZ molybdopterin-dependent catalytic subunit